MSAAATVGNTMPNTMVIRLKDDEEPLLPRCCGDGSVLMKPTATSAPARKTEPIRLRRRKQDLEVFL